MKKEVFAFLVFGLLVLGLSPFAFTNAHASLMTVDFSSGAYSFPPGSGEIYTEKGMVFSTPLGSHIDSNVGSGILRFHEGGANAADQVVVSAFGLGVQFFDLISFDQVAPTSACNNQLALVITSSDGDVVNIPQGNLGTVNLNFKAVSSVTIDPKPDGVFTGNVCMDNYVFEVIPIGGELLPIDTTALLLAGFQTNLAWIIPVALSAVGIGVILVRKKF